MGGLVGRIFREFAVTIGAAVLISGTISLTLTPMLASRFLRPPASIHHGRIYAFTERLFQGMLGLYDWSLRLVLRHKPATLVLSLAVLIATGFLFKIVPKGFLPSEDRNMLQIQTEAAQDVSYRSMFEHQQAVAAVLQRDPSIEAFMSRAGGRGGGPVNTGMCFLLLKPRAERQLTADQVVQALRPKLAMVPGIKAYPINPPTIPVGGQSSKSLYQYTLQGPDTDELYACATRLMDEIGRLPGFLDVTSDMQLKNAELNISINRDLASALGLSAEQIETALLNAYGSRQVSTIFAATNQYAVLLELLPEFQESPAALMAGLPIALGYGAGGEARRPLGLAVVGGLLFSQSLTLYVTPVFYVCMERFAERRQRWFGRA